MTAGFRQHVAGSVFRYMIVLFVFAVVAGLIYSPAIRGPFILDDWGDIQTNPAIRMTEISWNSLADAAWRSPFRTRPVAYISFALNHRVHGYDVAGYRLVNIGLHVLTAFLLGLFIQVLAAAGVAQRTSKTAAFWGAMLWLVLPVNTSSVNYVVQRMNILAALFFVLTLLLYVHGRLAESRTKATLLFISAGVSGLLGLGSKETCAMLPLFILLLEAFFRTTPNRRRTFGLLFAGAFAAGVIVLTGFAATEGRLIEKIGKIQADRDFSLGQGILTSGRAAVYYLSLAMWPDPYRLNPDHAYPLSRGWTAPATTIPAFAALACLAVFAIRFGSRNRLISFALFWFLGNLAVESSGLTNETLFEHRMYLPAMLLFPAATACFINTMRRFPSGALAVLGGAAVLLSLWTLERNHVWSEPLTLWGDCADKSPGSARVLNNYGKALLDEGQTRAARRVFYRSLQFDPGHGPAHNNLASILAEEGNLPLALEHLEAAVRLKPESPVARMNLAMALHHTGRFDEAIVSFGQALELAPDDAQIHSAFADCLADRHKTDEAIRHYRIAIRLNPRFAGAHHNLGVLLAQNGLLEGAIRHFSLALELSPGNPEAMRHLRLARRQAGQENR